MADGVGVTWTLRKLVEFHRSQLAKKCTLTAVQPSARFGALDVNATDGVRSFLEKPKGDGAWINGGFFVCDPSVIDLIDSRRYHLGTLPYGDPCRPKRVDGLPP